jgi:arylsulfatase A-like enzyme
VVAITADHGEHFVERGSLSGHRPYDEKLHVPLIINGWDDQGEYDDLVGLMDLSPTLVDQAGLNCPDTWCGQSLRKLVFEGQWDRSEILGGYGYEDDKVLMYRDTQWKFISRAGDVGDELYNLDKDPGETRNVIDQRPSIVSRISEHLGQYEEKIRATNKDAEREEVEMDEEVKERLRRLGYQE